MSRTTTIHRGLRKAARPKAYGQEHSLKDLTDSYQPFPRQRQFHTSPAKYRLFGGAAGPGKTKALLWEAIAQAMNVSGSDSLLLRRTYPELESSLLSQFRRDVPRWAYRSYNESKHLLRGRTARLHASATAETRTTSTSIKAQSFCSLASMS